MNSNRRIDYEANKYNMKYEIFALSRSRFAMELRMPNTLNNARFALLAPTKESENTESWVYVTYTRVDPQTYRSAPQAQEHQATRPGQLATRKNLRRISSGLT